MINTGPLPLTSEVWVVRFGGSGVGGPAARVGRERQVTYGQQYAQLSRAARLRDQYYGRSRGDLLATFTLRSIKATQRDPGAVVTVVLPAAQPSELRNGMQLARAPRDVRLS
jgi:hypothetical protein